MTFATPELLWLLLAPVALLAWELTHRRRRAGVVAWPERGLGFAAHDAVIAGLGLGGQFLFASNRRFAVHPQADSIVRYRIDPATGNLWFAATSSGNVIVLVNRSGVEQRRIDLGAQGVTGDAISGLAFAPDGSLRVATSQGVVYKVTV